ncbi:MAG: DUF819 family protein [Spirochaetia bacterium]|jgi:uncharacterized membrane protein
MLAAVGLVLFIVLFPILVIWLGEKRFALVDKIGAVVVCYAAGILLGNIGILPKSAAGVQNIASSIAIPIALPLMFFSLDMKSWARSSGRALLAFGLEVIAVVIVSVAGFFLFKGSIGAETWKLTGMLNGVYTGGTINLAAIGTALGVSPTLYVAANTSDIVISGLYLLFLVTIGKRVIGVFLPAWRKPAGAVSEVKIEEWGSYAGFFSKGRLLPLLGALGVALLIFGIGAVFSLLLPGQWGTITTILVITTVGIAASFIGPLRRIRMTYQLGHYFILVFCLVVGSMADLGRLASSIPGVIGYVSVAIFGSLILHVALCAIFRIDTDTMIITSVAGICSPPFVPMIAAALKNRDIIVAGIVTGIIGWVIGTYLGIGISTALHAFIPAG